MHSIWDSRTSRVLLGIDDSDSALRALDYAVGAAQRANAHLLALYVQPDLPSVLAEQTAVEAFLAHQQTLIEDLRREIAYSCESASVTHEFLIVQGDPYTELKRLARSAHVDAVVVGISTRARHKILPSVVTRLVRAAHWPITVVP